VLSSSSNITQLSITSIIIPIIILLRQQLGQTIQEPNIRIRTLTPRRLITVKHQVLISSILGKIMRLAKAHKHLNKTLTQSTSTTAPRGSETT
jgi:hypothetical protein